MVDSALLEPITVVSAPAVTTFLAGEKFTVGTQDGVKIGWIGDSFELHFQGREEIDVPAQSLRVHKLKKNSPDMPIIEDLGGEDFVETNLATMWEQMKRQGLGQQGVLLTNGWANIFYIEDDNGGLWAVYCSWNSARGAYWRVGARPVTHPDDWLAGNQFFSR